MQRAKDQNIHSQCFFVALRFEMIKNPKFNLTHMDSPTHVKITEVSGYNKSTFRYFTKLSQDRLGNETTDW